MPPEMKDVIAGCIFTVVLLFVIALLIIGMTFVGIEIARAVR